MADNLAGGFFGFPKVKPQFYTMINFYKYFRPKPRDPSRQVTETSVRLPLPSSLQDSFGMDVNSTNFDLLGNLPTTTELPSVGDLSAAGQSVMDKVESQYNAGGVMGIMKNVTGSALALTPGISDSGPGKYFQANMGVVRNPHLTTLFEGVKLKNFTFVWKLSPKSQDEAREMNSMIQLVKQYMHPALLANGFALEYPYLATVNFNTGDSSKFIMPNVGYSFLTGLDIDSSTAGIPAFYKDGQPVTITLQMAFTEINIRTREDFQ